MDQTLIKRYLQGMVGLYGAIAEDEALEIIRSLETEPVTALELTLVNLDDSIVVRFDDVLVHEAIESDEDLEDLLEWQDEKPFYVPDRETLLKYGDGQFFERSPAYDELKAFLVTEMGVDPETAEGICSDLHGYSTISDLEPADVPFEFARRQIELGDPERADRLMQLVRALERNTRQWINRGYTFEELPDPDFEFPEEEWVYNPDSLLLDVMVALVNLYGIVPLRLAADVFNRFGERTVTTEDIETLDLAEELITVQDDCLMAAELTEDEDQLETLHQEQDDKPYYLPEPAVLIQYADETFFEETPQYERLRAYLQKRWFQEETAADDVCAEIALICRDLNFSMDLVLDWLEENGVTVESDRQIRELTTLVFDLFNHTRLWSHRGHTPAEIKDMSDSTPTQASSTKAAGRNDLCPCGSGKKYKNCCGQ